VIRGGEKLAGVHPDLVRVVHAAGAEWDLVILEGVRSLARQKEMVAQRKSKTLDSKHLKQSDGFVHAVDLAFYPVDWNDTRRFYYMGGVLRGVALSLGVNLRWGGDWDSDTEVKDQLFNDLVHVEVSVSQNS